MAAGGIILYSLFRKGAALGTLNFYPGTVKDIEFDNSVPVMTLGLVVQNTSNQYFNLNSIAGNVYANDKYVGNVSSFIVQHIPANSQTTIFLNLRMNLIGIVTDIINAFTTHNTSQVLKLEATANIDTLQVPVNISYTVG